MIQYAPGGGGVGIYVKNTYKLTTRTYLSIFIPHILESIFVEIHFKNKSILVATIYRPNTPPKADMDIFMFTLSELQMTLNRENKDVLILGDININMLKFQDHPKTNEYLDNIFASGFMPLITKPTRVTQYSATLIDHIIQINVKSMAYWYNNM